MALREGDKSLDAMNALHDPGVGIAFDDFGTGYESLCSLHLYPLTTLKIDRAFVGDLSIRPRDAAITRALISTSRDLVTIAEGIETAEQEGLLGMLGCHAAQGYQYGKPMPIDDLLATLDMACGQRASG